MTMLRTDLALPPLYQVRQRLDESGVKDLPGAVRHALEESGALAAIKPGQRIVLTAGSRGIANIPVILRAAVDTIRDRGAEAVVLPTMGSHGGATPQGQIDVLRSLGVTEESVGAPIVSSLETIELGQTPEGIPVYGSSDAAAADGIVVIGRVKPHTDFRGPLESGLAKMMVIGLGKHRGALTAHSQGRVYGLSHVIPAMARVVLRTSRILGGVAIMENGRDETAAVRGVPADGLLEAEEDLQRQAKDLLGRLPYTTLDLLVVDEIGKNISGAGMDTNVVGRVPNGPHGTVTQLIEVRRMFARGLSEQTHGNAVGVGLADVVHRRLEEGMDRRLTYVNALTSGWLECAKLPLVAESDREGIAWCLITGAPAAGGGPGGDTRNARIARIKNTLELEHLWVSQGLLEETRANAALEVVRGPVEWDFDAAGDLGPFAC
ncbi:MAG: lactate racemase domain-containing protein [Chloroflexota bacterium]